MNKRRGSFSTGIGVGYVTLVMIFAVVGLTVLAVMAYQSAGANDVLNEKSVAYTQQYYDADVRAKEKLMLLDKAAYEAAESAFFDSRFEEQCSDIEGVTLRKTMQGYAVTFSEPINDALSIRVEVLFYSIPNENGRYKLQEYKTVSADSAESDKPLGVWDGDPLIK